MNLVWVGLRVIWGDDVDGHRQVEAVHQGDVKVILQVKLKKTEYRNIIIHHMFSGNELKQSLVFA